MLFKAGQNSRFRCNAKCALSRLVVKSTLCHTVVELRNIVRAFIFADYNCIILNAIDLYVYLYISIIIHLSRSSHVLGKMLHDSLSSLELTDSE